MLLSGTIMKRDRSEDLTKIYIGTAPAGSSDDDPVWNIRRITIGIDGNYSEILWAEGNSLLTVAWSDRLTLTYK